MALKCDICEDSGWYPILDNYGFKRYSIRCPECGGDHNKEEPEIIAHENYWAETQRRKYIEAMAEKRQREMQP